MDETTAKRKGNRTLKMDVPNTKPTHQVKQKTPRKTHTGAACEENNNHRLLTLQKKIQRMKTLQTRMRRLETKEKNMRRLASKTTLAHLFSRIPLVKLIELAQNSPRGVTEK